jgi:hypothetical protein
VHTDSIIHYLVHTDTSAQCVYIRACILQNSLICFILLYVYVDDERDHPTNSNVWNEQFEITFWNVQGLPSKANRNSVHNDMFYEAVKLYDCIGLVESWYDVDNTKHGCDIDIPRYDKFCIGRSSNHRTNVRGGIVFYFKSVYRTAITLVKEDHGDQMWVKLEGHAFGLEKDLYIATVYISPDNSSIWAKRDFDPFDILKNNITRFAVRGNIMIGGDLNARISSMTECQLWEAANEKHCPLYDMYKHDVSYASLRIPESRNSKDPHVNNYGKSLIDVCTASDLCILNGRTIGDVMGNTTCYTYNGCSVVDYVIVSPPLHRSVASFQVKSLSPLSDHCQLSVICNTAQRTIHNTPPKKKGPKLKSTFKFVWDNHSESRFTSMLMDAESKQEVANFLMCPFNSNMTETSSAVDRFTNIVLGVANRSLKQIKFPVRKARRKKQWYDASCSVLKRNAEHARVAFTANPYNNTAKLRYFYCKKIYKKTLKYKQREHKKQLLHKLDSLSTSDPAAYWRLVKSLSNEDNTEPSAISNNDWCEHFSKLATTESEDKVFHKEVEDAVGQFNSCSKTSIPEMNNAITASEVRKAVSKLKSRKSAGPDLITNEMLKVWSKYYIDSMLRLFNVIIDSECFPDPWRLSHLIPIFKKGDPNNVDNYRGIALSNSLSKLFLSILTDRLVNHVETNGLIDPAQHGFRKGHSTIDNMFIVNALVHKAKAAKRKLYTCFVDFRKAFDTVWTTGLLYKLQQVGITGKLYQLFKSMYSGVHYEVKTKLGRSGAFNSTRGLRQGCVSSPLMFNLYINDLQDYITTDDAPSIDKQLVSHLLFADDLVLFSNSAKGLQNSLNQLELFCTDWKLDVNLSKTKVVVFGSVFSRVLKQTPIFFKTNVIEVVKPYTYLGIIFTHTGSFQQAYNAQRNKALHAWHNIKAYMSCYGKAYCTVRLKDLGSRASRFKKANNISKLALGHRTQHVY